jgi:hypothetical protein
MIPQGMLTDDPAYDPEELESAYRLAARFFLQILESSIAHALSAKTTQIGIWQIRFGLGLAEKSMSDIAAQLGVTPACISKGAHDFIRKNSLPVPNGMEGEESQKAHRAARVRNLRD